MNTRKLLEKIAYGLNAALIIFLVGFLLYQQRLIKQMSENEQKARPATAILDSNELNENSTHTTQVLTQTPPKDEGGVEQRAERVEQLRYQLEASEEELDMTREELANKKLVDEGLQERADFDRKMLEDPDAMKWMRRNNENAIRDNCRELFEKLGLPDIKLQALITLLVDHELQEWENLVNVSDPTMTDEKLKELSKQAEDQMAEFEKQLKEILGTEDYKIYNAWEDASSERDVFYSLDNSFCKKLGLSDEKIQELIDALYKSRKNVEAKYDGFDVNYFDSDDPNLAEQINRKLEVCDAYIESARRVLSDTEFTQFEARINEDKEYLKAYLPL